MSELKRTPIYPEYEDLGARTIDFGGWDMPVQFKGIKHEHEVTRTKAGLFDVSHMGEIVVKGPKSLDFLQTVVTNDVSNLTPTRAQYTFMCNEDGGTIDDFLIYMIEKDYYLLVVNAANTEKDFNWLKKHNSFGDEVTIEDASDHYALLALQGPKAEEILQTLTETNLQEIKLFAFENAVLFKPLEVGALVSRTGYTGEDGFEIYIDASHGRKLWNLILEAGADHGVEPIGLGARDTLRFEVGLPLYGQELDKDITPIEAGLQFAVKVNKGTDFIGREKLQEHIENGPPRKIVGLEMIDKGIPRTGYKVFVDEEEVGVITSGTQSPTLQKNIGNALIKSEFANVGDEVLVQVRKRTLKAVIVKRPFYKR